MISAIIIDKYDTSAVADPKERDGCHSKAVMDL